LKAAVFRSYGQNPEEIEKIEDCQEYVIGPNDVLFRVEAAALNHNDLWAMYGDPIKSPLPHISGSDAAGVVIKVGGEVKKLKIGDRVVSHANLSCRVCAYCTSGREYDCPDRKIWGSETGPLWGAFSQFSYLPEVNLVKIPDELSFEDAAAVSMTGLTAWHMLMTRAGIRPGQTILVTGGGSGLGSIAIQIGKLFNCIVIATAGSDEKIERCLNLGADYAINHRLPDWNKKVREITKKKGIDVVFEHVGKEMFPLEITLLKAGGTLVTAGATTGYDSKIDLRYLFFKGTSLLGCTLGARAETEDVIRLTSSGEIKPVIDSIVPMTDIARAHSKMASGEFFGKIVVLPQKV
jgi:alcohol dehydrogenase